MQNGLLVHQNITVTWPAKITDKGGKRDQFLHVIDVVPTILEAAGVAPPQTVDGVEGMGK